MATGLTKSVSKQRTLSFSQGRLVIRVVGMELISGGGRRGRKSNLKVSKNGMKECVLNQRTSSFMRGRLVARDLDGAD